MLVDDAPLGKPLRRMLAHYDVELFDTRDPFEALQLARDTKPQVALVDYFMPLMNGPEVIRQLRPEFPQLIIGAISGDMDDEKTTECKAAGADWTLIKSFDREDLVAQLRLGGARVVETPDPGFPLEMIKEIYILAELEAQGGNVAATARSLKVDRNTVKRYASKKK